MRSAPDPDRAEQFQLAWLDAETELFLKLADRAPSDGWPVGAILSSDVTAGPDHYLSVERVVLAPLSALQSQEVAASVAHDHDRQRLNQREVGLHGLSASESAPRGEQLDKLLRRRPADPCVRLKERRHGVGGKKQDLLLDHHRLSGRTEPLGGGFGALLQC
ncbi:MAG: hypothetical protein F4X11_04015 [Acidobacteria bacterium]|nr:hypothetical protein [Acidobacteriota bacterium]